MRMNKIDIDNLRLRAWTFRGMTPPNRATKVAEEQINGELYEYYMDSDGNVYYETTSGREWKQKILEWEKERKRRESKRR